MRETVKHGPFPRAKHREVGQERLGLLFMRAARRQGPAEILVARDPAAIGVLRAQGEMQEADLRSNQGNDFVPGFHREVRPGFWLDKRPKSHLTFCNFFKEAGGRPQNQAVFLRLSHEQPGADLDRPTRCRPIQEKASAPPVFRPDFS